MPSRPVAIVQTIGALRTFCAVEGLQSGLLRDLRSKARPDMVVGPHAEGIEAQRLLAFAGDGNDDRGPFDFVGFAAR